MEFKGAERVGKGIPQTTQPHDKQRLEWLREAHRQPVQFMEQRRTPSSYKQNLHAWDCVYDGVKLLVRACCQKRSRSSQQAEAADPRAPGQLVGWDGSWWTLARAGGFIRRQGQDTIVNLEVAG